MFDLYFQPNYIHTKLDLEQVIKIGVTTETVTLDFKTKIELTNLSPKKKREVAEELALDICQFANAWGGVLIIGIKEDIDKSRGLKVASEYVDYLDFDSLSEFINNNVIPTGLTQFHESL